MNMNIEENVKTFVLVNPPCEGKHDADHLRYVGMGWRVKANPPEKVEVWACPTCSKHFRRNLIVSNPVPPSCECGEWSGERCPWSGPRDETVIVEYMPAWVRAAHIAAGGTGSFPDNGASRIRVAEECAERMLDVDGEWCKVVPEKRMGRHEHEHRRER